METGAEKVDPSNKVTVKTNNRNMSRRKFLKLGGAIGVSLMGLEGNNTEKKGNGGGNPSGQGELLQRSEKYPNYEEGGWDRVLVRTKILGNSFENMEGRKIYKKLEELGRPFEDFPKSVWREFCDEIENRLGERMNGEGEALVIKEIILEKFNNLRRINAEIAEIARHQFHQIDLSEMVVMSKQFWELNSFMEDVLDGREDGVGGVEAGKAASVLVRLWEEKFSGNERGFLVEKARELLNERGIGSAITWGELESPEKKHNPDKLEEGDKIVEFVIEEFSRMYPVMMSVIKYVNFTADIEETEGEFLGLAHRGQGGIEVVIDPEWERIVLHELNHYLQTDWTPLFDENNPRLLHSVLSTASVTESFELMKRLLENQSRLLSAAIKLTPGQIDWVFHEWNEGFGVDYYENLLEVAEAVFPEKGRDEELTGHLQRLKSILENASENESFRLNQGSEALGGGNFSSVRQVLVGLFDRTKDNRLEEGIDEGKVGRVLAKAGASISHLLVNPPFEDLVKMKMDNVPFDQENPFGIIKQIILDQFGSYQEWWSGGEINKEEIVNQGIRPQLAILLKFAKVPLPDSYIGINNSGLLWIKFNENGASGVVDNHFQSVKPFFEDRKDFDLAWTAFLAKMSGLFIEMSQLDGEIIDRSPVFSLEPFFNCLTNDQVKYFYEIHQEVFIQLEELGLVGELRGQ